MSIHSSFHDANSTSRSDNKGELSKALASYKQNWGTKKNVLI